jgi:hypothetical protein
MFKPVLALLCVAVIVFSCGKKSNSGFVLQSAFLYDSPAPGKQTGIVPAGSAIEYIGTMPIPDLINTFVKIRVDSTEGYIDGSFACFGCTLAAVKEEARVGGPSMDFTVAAGRLVAFDSTKGDQSHVYLDGSMTSGWTSTNNLSTDPADVAAASVIARFESGELDPDRYAAFARLVEQDPANGFIQTIKIDLSEAQEQDLADMQDQYGLIFNQKENKVFTTRGVANNWIEKYMMDIFMRVSPDEEGNGEEYSSPRYHYYDKYMSALPSFVNLTAKSYGYSWDHGNVENRSRAYLLFRLDRSPGNITSLWSNYRNFIITVLESGNVRDVRPYVNELIKVYDHITSMPNHRAVVKEISKRVAAWDKENTNDDGYINSGYIQIDQAEIYAPLIEQEKYDTRTDGLAVWYHSFWVRRFAEGNEKVVYDILKEVANINPPEMAPDYDGDDTAGDVYEVGDGYDPNDERGDAEPGPQVYSDCVFQDYSVGDCGHIEFSCGDFGDADASGLPADQLAVWEDLVIADSDGERPNPKYVGKSFSIGFELTTGPACNEGQGGQGEIQKITSFIQNE